MEVRLDRITDERFEWSESFSIPVPELEETDLVDLGEIQCRGRIERTSHTSFLLTATLEYRQTLACVRCLGEIEMPITHEVQLLVNVGRPKALARSSASGPGEKGLVVDKKAGKALAKEARAARAAGSAAEAAHGGEGGEEIELVEEDLGVVSLVDPVLDTRPIVIEQIHLGIPMKPLCREDCKGLCGTCGGDLNEGPCGCSPAGDARLAKLAALRGRVGGEN